MMVLFGRRMSVVGIVVLLLEKAGGWKEAILEVSDNGESVRERTGWERDSM